MRVWVEWSEPEGVATVFHDRMELRDEASVRDWQAQVVPQLERLGGKVPLLVCIDGVTIHPAIADAYGAGAKELVGRFASAFARYGHPATVRAIIAVEALRHGYRANLFEDRASALRFVRAQLEPPSRGR